MAARGRLHRRRRRRRGRNAIFIAADAAAICSCLLLLVVAVAVGVAACFTNGVAFGVVNGGGVAGRLYVCITEPEPEPESTSWACCAMCHGIAVMLTSCREGEQ